MLSVAVRGISMGEALSGRRLEAGSSTVAAESSGSRVPLCSAGRGLNSELILKD